MKAYAKLAKNTKGVKITQYQVIDLIMNLKEPLGLDFQKNLSLYVDKFQAAKNNQQISEREMELLK